MAQINDGDVIMSKKVHENIVADLSKCKQISIDNENLTREVERFNHFADSLTVIIHKLQGENNLWANRVLILRRENEKLNSSLEREKSESKKAYAIGLGYKDLAVKKQHKIYSLERKLRRSNRIAFTKLGELTIVLALHTAIIATVIILYED